MTIKTWAKDRMTKEQALAEYDTLDGLEECRCCGGWCVTDDRIECDRCGEKVCDACAVSVAHPIFLHDKTKMCLDCEARR